jgi:hypothetical protein
MLRAPGLVALKALRVAVMVLMNEECWHCEDFEFEGKTPPSGVKEHAKWTATTGKDAAEEEEDPAGKGYNIDYRGAAWAYEFTMEWCDRREGYRSSKRVVTLLKRGEDCAFEEFLTKRETEAPRTFHLWDKLPY